jgi:hypothetical protein
MVVRVVLGVESLPPDNFLVFEYLKNLILEGKFEIFFITTCDFFFSTTKKESLLPGYRESAAGVNLQRSFFIEIVWPWHRDP